MKKTTEKKRYNKKKVIACFVLFILIGVYIWLRPPAIAQVTITDDKSRDDDNQPKKDTPNTPQWLKWLLIGLAVSAFLILVVVRRLPSKSTDTPRTNLGVLQLLETSPNEMNCGLHSFIQGEYRHETGHFMSTRETEPIAKQMRSTIIGLMENLRGGPTWLDPDPNFPNEDSERDIKEIKNGATLTENALMQYFSQEHIKNHYLVRIFTKHKKNNIMQRSSNNHDKSASNLKQINIFHKGAHFELILRDLEVKYGRPDKENVFAFSHIKRFAPEQIEDRTL